MVKLEKSHLMKVEIESTPNTMSWMFIQEEDKFLLANIYTVL